VGTLNGVIKKDIDKKTVLVKLSGTAEVSGTRADNGLGRIKGTVTLTGEAEAKRNKSKLTLGKQTIHAKGQVHGELSGTIDTPFEFDFAEPVEADIDNFNQPVAVSHDAIPVALNIALDGLKSFTPENVAVSVPEIRRLMLIRRLLLETRAFISNRFDMREVLKGALEQEGHETLNKLRAWGLEKYPMLQIAPQKASASGGNGGGGASGGGASGGGASGGGASGGGASGGGASGGGASGGGASGGGASGGGASGS
jgi:type VI secretion system ImpB/VipA family protein